MEDLIMWGSDFFEELGGVEEGVEEVQPVAVNHEKKGAGTVPSGFREILPSSCGKLSVPHKLRIRDYTVDNIFKISENSNNILKSILEVLKEVIFEDVDPYSLHEKELEEILVSIYTSFWSPVIKDYNYLALANEEDFEALKEMSRDRAINSIPNFSEKSEEEKEKLLEGIAEKSYTDFIEGKVEYFTNIDLQKLKTKPIPKEFKEPIIIKDKETGSPVFSFRLRRIGDVFKATDYIEKEFVYEDQAFANFDKEKEPEKVEEFESYVKDKTHKFYTAVKALQIVAYDFGEGLKDLESIEEKIEAFSKISYSYWLAVDKIVEDFDLENFGIQTNVEVVSPITNKVCNRRCHFRPLDFIHSYELQSDIKYDFGFGS